MSYLRDMEQPGKQHNIEIVDDDEDDCFAVVAPAATVSCDSIAEASKMKQNAIVKRAVLQQPTKDKNICITDDNGKCICPRVPCPVELFEAKQHCDALRAQMAREKTSSGSTTNSATESQKNHPTARQNSNTTTSASSSTSGTSKASSKSMSEKEIREEVSCKPSYEITETELNSMPTLHRAIWNGKFDKVRRYLNLPKTQKKCNKQDFFGRTALHVAASCGHVSSLRLLLTMKLIKVDLMDREGHTPLAKAVQFGSIPCAAALIDAGADLLKESFKDISVIEHAIFNYHCDKMAMMKYLINRGFPEDFKNWKGMTLLHLAAMNGDAEKTEYIVEKTKHMFNNATDSKGRTPLMLACVFDRHESAEVLFRLGVDAEIRDLDNKNALTHAKPDTKTAELLQLYLNSPEEFTEKRRKISINSQRVSVERSEASQKSDGAIIDALKVPEDPQIQKLKNMVAKMQKTSQAHQQYLAETQKYASELQQQIETVQNERQQFRQLPTTVPVRVDKKTGHVHHADIDDPTRQKYLKKKSLFKRVKKVFTKHRKPDRKLSPAEWTAEYEGLITKHDGLIAEIQKVVDDNEELEVMNSDMQEYLDEMTTLKDCENQEIGKLNERLSELWDQLKQTDEDIKGKLAEVSEIEAKIGEQDKVIAEDDNNIKEYSERAKKYKRRLTSMNADYKAMEKESNAKIEALEKELRKLNDVLVNDEFDCGEGVARSD